MRPPLWAERRGTCAETFEQALTDVLQWAKREREAWL